MGNSCRCEVCCPGGAEYTYTEEWRAYCEAAQVSLWPEEGRKKYYARVAEARGEPAALRLVAAVKAELKARSK